MAAEPETVATDALGRPVVLVHARSIRAVPRRIAPPRTHHVLLVAMDADATDADDRLALVDDRLEEGCAYVCTWGPGASWIDRDLEDGGIADADGNALPTTWQEGTPLAEAVWFWMELARPDGVPAAETCLVAVVVGDPAWAATVRAEIVRRAAERPS